MSRRLIIGLVVGTAVGTLVGLLLRPHRGSYPRQASEAVPEPVSRFTAFKSRVRLRFEDTAESIKPAI